MSSRPHHSLGHPCRRDIVIIIFLCVASTIEIELKDTIIPGLGEGEDYWWPNPCLADEAVQCTVQYSTVATSATLHPRLVSVSPLHSSPHHPSDSMGTLA